MDEKQINFAYEVADGCHPKDLAEFEEVMADLRHQIAERDRKIAELKAMLNAVINDA